MIAYDKPKVGMKVEAWQHDRRLWRPSVIVKLDKEYIYYPVIVQAIGFPKCEVCCSPKELHVLPGAGHPPKPARKALEAGG